MSAKIYASYWIDLWLILVSHPANPADTQDAVRQTMSEWIDSFNKNDPKVISSFYERLLTRIRV